MKRETHSPAEVDALPRKERKATKRYLKDYKKSYRMEAKAQYKKLGGKRGLRKLEETSDGSVINTKTGKKVNYEDYVKAMRYQYIFRTTTPQNVKRGLRYVSTAASIASIMAVSYSTMLARNR